MTTQQSAPVIAPDITAPRSGAPALAAAAVTVVLWASAFVAIRHVGHDLAAGPLALGRLLVGSLVLGGLVAGQRLRAGRARRRDPATATTGAAAATQATGAAATTQGAGRRTNGAIGGTAASDAADVASRGGGGWPRGAAWVRVAVCGVLWFGVYNVSLNSAEHRVDAGTASMLVNVGPVLLAVLAGVALREGFPRPVIVGTVVAFGGVVVIGVSTTSPTGGDRVGVLLCLLSAVAYAVSMVVQKPLLARVSALRVTWLACTVGAVVCLPFAPELVRQLGSAPAASIGWVVFLGALPTALAFTTWAYALARTDAGRLGTTTYLVPPLTILLGWALLSETPPLLTLAGGAVCLVGVYLSRRRPRRPVVRRTED